MGNRKINKKEHPTLC